METDPEQLEARLNRIERDHRALVLEHTALLNICRILLPHVDIDEATLTRLLATAYAAAKSQADDVFYDARAEWPRFDATWNIVTAGIRLAARHRSQAQSTPDPAPASERNSQDDPPYKTA